MQLEWLTSIPWPNSTPLPPTPSQLPPSSELTQQAPTQLLHTRTFLTDARAQLDADHFGLEKIKKRLIEYLAVVKLKEMNAERELAAERKEKEDQAAQALPDSKAEGGPENGQKADTNSGKKDASAQTQSPAQPQQLQVAVPNAIPGKPQGRLGRKSVKGPILLYVFPPSYPHSH